MKNIWYVMAVLAMVAAAYAWWAPRNAATQNWTPEELAALESLWLGSLPPLPPDPGNAVADNERAARLGQRLFFDTRLSSNGAVSCATCHQPERRFTDGLPKGRGLGLSRRNTRSIVGVAYSPWLYWDGRKDSLWSQALSPIEDPNEHGFSRVEVAELMLGDADYRREYEALFGLMPAGSEDGIERIFANAGKAIAAYERRLLPGPSRFDEYVAALRAGETAEAILTPKEARGLRLFIGKANCTQCHNGPLFTNHEFHNTGLLSFPGEPPDKGRVQGVREVLADPFNCLGPYSDDGAGSCAELEFVRTGPELIGAMRTPSLRNLDGTGPYGHKGQLTALADVLAHYNEAPAAMIGHNEAKPLGLGKRELDDLEAFLEALAAPLVTPLDWLQPAGAR